MYQKVRNAILLCREHKTKAKQINIRQQAKDMSCECKPDVYTKCIQVTLFSPDCVKGKADKETQVGFDQLSVVIEKVIRILLTVPAYISLQYEVSKTILLFLCQIVVL